MEITKILEYIDKLHTDKLDALREAAAAKFKSQEIKYQSDDIDQLATALAKAQGEFKVADLGKVNPYFKARYADLKDVVMAARPALSKNGLSVIQNLVTLPSGETFLHTILMHNSGQFIKSSFRSKAPKDDIQSIASHVTYLKRMTYAALIGIVTGDEDDDGETAVATTREVFAKGTALNHKYNPRENSAEIISKEQLEELEYELTNWPDIAEMVLDGLRLQSLADMPKSKYRVSIDRVRHLKGVREGKLKVEDLKK